MSGIVAYHPHPHELAYTFGGRAPVARVTPGTLMRISTEDCFGGKVRTVDDLPSLVCEFPRLNPVSGPFHVAGAEPGDTLALHLVSITPARDYGFSSTFPHFGALTSTHTTAMLQPPLEERVWRYEIDAAAGTVRYAARCSDYTVDLPLEPMLGTVGVAPAADEVRMTLVPDVHGGNMDTPELQPGVTLYLPVFVEGALFALGDGHARQGHGEVCGVAVEIPTHTVLVVDLIKGVSTPGPRLESETQLLSVGSARPLEDAYQLVSQAGTASVGNVCDTNYTMLAAIDKAYLPGALAYGGIHQRLRAAADH